MSIKQIIKNADPRIRSTFDSFIQCLIVVSLITFSLQTLPNLSATQRATLGWIEVFTVIVFTIEYILRIVISDQPLKFITSFFGLIDLVAILPFYLSLGVDLRSVRAFRLLRIFQMLKLARYSQAIQRFHRAMIIAREEMVLFGVVALMVLYIAAVGIYYFENVAQPKHFASVFHSLWWATATLTTVGYGDVYPVTLGGRCFTFLVLIVGLGIVSVPAGLVASALSKARAIEDEKT